MTAAKKPGHGPRLLKYLASGGVAFAVEYGLFLVLLTSVRTVIAAALSFLAGLLTSFVLNRNWSFSDGTFSSGKARQFGAYALLAGCNMVLSGGIVLLGERLGAAPALGKIAAIGLIAAWNYVLFNRVIFKRSA